MQGQSSRYKVALIALSIFVINKFTAASELVEAAQADPIVEQTIGFEKETGFITLYYNAAEEKVFLEIEDFASEFLYTYLLTSGLGSRYPGFDPGEIRADGTAKLVKFVRREGAKKVLLVQPNYAYRGEGIAPEGGLDGHRFFPPSVLASFPVLAESDDRVLVDATEFFQRDVLRVGKQFEKREYGDYSLAADRSSFVQVRSFPENSEIEMEQTFVSATAQPADDLGSVLPSAEAFTIGVRHSLVRLPASDFRPRAFHPGCGYFSTDSYDPAAPLGESVRHQFIDRHHLKPGEKLIYYVDATAPPEIQEIMIEATESWNAAFAEIGLPDAIDAQVMPPDVDPMDVRHNVILWVHRKLRGWSYAQWIADPRTGEIFSSRIILDSQRIRLDYLIAEAMLSPWDGKADDAVHERIEALVHDRLRILVAHEVGHTLGLRHNFAANTYGRESVMDYPFPQWKLGRDGRITWDDAYKYRPGAWDHAAIRYGYMTAEDADESAALQDVLADMSRENLLFLTDPDAGTLDGAHPLAHRWDTEGGEQERRDALFFLRRMALDRFSIHAIREGKPMTELEERFVHVYLLHRYEIEAAAKLLGGVEYNYARRGEAVANEIVASDRQKAALNWLINCLRADHLTVPAEALALLVPQSHGFARDPERVFVGYAGRPFDPLAAAGSLADHIAAHLLEPSRATRLLEQKALRRQEFGFADVVDELIKKVWLYRPEDSVRGEYQRVASHALLRRLMLLAKNNETQPQVRAIAHAALYEMRVGLEGRLSSRGFIDWRAFDRYSYRLIERFDEDPDDAEIVNFLELPIGPPIGGGAAACGVAER